VIISPRSEWYGKSQEYQRAIDCHVLLEGCIDKGVPVELIPRQDLDGYQLYIYTYRRRKKEKKMRPALAYVDNEW